MFEYNVNLRGRMEVTVVAENKEEAERILNDTIDSITVKDIKEKLSRCNEVEIKESRISTDMTERRKDRGVER